MADDLLAQMDQRLTRIEAQLHALQEYALEIRRLSSPWATPLADGKLLIHTLHSVLMIVESSDLIITPQLVVYRQWEPDLTQLLWNSFRSDTVFVDVGANVGYFTLLAAAGIHAGGTGRVIAVEPNPECCALIERDMVINWSMCEIALHNVAVGATKGEVWLSYPPDRAANAQISFDGEADGKRKFPVPLDTLDAIVPEGLAVNILKIDVEGHEYSVFRGARRVIAQSPDIRIIMEWSQKQMKETGVTPDAMQDEFRNLGLVARWLPSTQKLDDLTPENSPLIPFEELSEMFYENILLTKG